MYKFKQHINISDSYNFAIAILLIATYLTLSATSFAFAATGGSGEISRQTYYGTETPATNGSSPCSHEENTNCCDTTFCNCGCHAPIASGMILKYAPLILLQSIREQSCTLPKVYLSIFVPPQNSV
ncbi:MAG: hypothetical protein PHN84_10020 [Desulfuromonadaceae bacterium]|nr:hypothetical protein [Desulfuromonadaceae bacterium]MDD2854182.1 hypothetical protein [Desulfuromonadaceae bacterium]